MSSQPQRLKSRSSFHQTPPSNPKNAAAPAAPLYTCCVCAESLPLSSYIDPESRDKLPYGCIAHLSPVYWLRNAAYGWDTDSESEYEEEQGSKQGISQVMPEVVCVECLRTHLVTQFRTIGAENVTCVMPCCKSSGVNTKWRDWRFCAMYWLPNNVRGAFNEELFKGWYARAHKWTCPAGCSAQEYTLHAATTPGYPHVECGGCKRRFCALCRVVWHAGQTCQEWQHEHPEHMHKVNSSTRKDASNADLEDNLNVEEMVKDGARFCPRCQMPIVKIAGCSSVNCANCHSYFDWSHAEKVRMPVVQEKPFKVISYKAFASRPFVSRASTAKRPSSSVVEPKFASRNPFAALAPEKVSREKPMRREEPDHEPQHDGRYSKEICELDRMVVKKAPLA